MAVFQPGEEIGAGAQAMIDDGLFERFPKPTRSVIISPLRAYTRLDPLPRARTSARSAQWHVPSVFWFVGGTDPDEYAKAKAAGKVNEIPSNHNPRFAPVIHPALRTGVEALVVAAGAWLSRASGGHSAATRHLKEGERAL
jgi:metal-dependent amidase/aminoacylase/carboxypeptidase family protein